MVKVGCCGWNYLNAERYFENWKKRFRSKLQAYAKLFDLVEVNSTFYKIPKLETVKRWREEVDEINKNFEFTLKCNKAITHESAFSSKAIETFDEMKKIAKVLRASILLMQTPASFKPTKKNIEKVRKFFSSIDREKFKIVWEVRWKKDWSKEIVKKLFREIKVNQCVDPFRQEIFYFKDVIYYRLHGLGSGMYNYKFSDSELKLLASKVKEEKEKKNMYVLFNNIYMYEDALAFIKLLKLLKLK